MASEEVERELAEDEEAAAAEALEASADEDVVEPETAADREVES
jgi:hypothetical protein